MDYSEHRNSRKERGQMTREEFEYAIKSCGCFIYRGQTYYEESELIKTFEDLGLIHIGLEQEPSGDLINRQDAIKAIDEKAKRIKNEDTLNGLAGAVGILFDLPSITQKSETVTEFADRCRECGAKYGKLLKQKPKEGHWIKVSDGYGDNAYICECSECKDTVWVYKDANRKWNFCPNCGAKMIEEQERENKG